MIVNYLEKVHKKYDYQLNKWYKKNYLTEIGQKDWEKGL